MEVEAQFIDVQAYHCDLSKERHYVKVTFAGMGMFINSFSVQPSQFENQPLWVQPPKHRQRGGFVPTVDFDKSYPLWQIIEHKARDAVKLCENCNDTFLNSARKDTVADVSETILTATDIPF
jgi:hypothetical protein